MITKQITDQITFVLFKTIGLCTGCNCLLQFWNIPKIRSHSCSDCASKTGPACFIQCISKTKKELDVCIGKDGGYHNYYEQNSHSAPGGTDATRMLSLLSICFCCLFVCLFLFLLLLILLLLLLLLLLLTLLCIKTSSPKYIAKFLLRFVVVDFL